MVVGPQMLMEFQILAVVQEQAIDLPGICNPLYLDNGRQVKGN